MATGQRAFMGDTGPVLQEAILKRAPIPARQLNPNVPARLEGIIHKSLQKDRTARYQTAAELRAELEALKRETEGKRTTYRWALAAGGIAALLITSALFWFVKHQPTLSTAPPDLKLRQLTTNSSENRVFNGAISPDAKYLAYTDLKGMHIKLIASGETQLVPQPEQLKRNDMKWEIVPAAWFPNSAKFLANAHPAELDPSRWSSENTSIWEVSVNGAFPRRIRDKAVAWSVSPDGSLISFGSNNGKFGEREIWLLEPSSGQARKILDTDEKGSVVGLTWLPERDRVLYISGDATGGSLVSRDLKGGPVTTLLRPSQLDTMGDGVWLPDGRWIFSMNESAAIHDTCNYWEMRVNPRTGETAEKPRRLTNWADFCVSNPSVTADGKRLAFLQMVYRDAVYVADLDSGGTRIRNSRHLVLDESYDYLQNWTPDSKAILFTSNRDGQYGIYKQSVDEDMQGRIVAGPVEFSQARVSPDGKWVIAFVSSEGNGASIVRVPITGGSPQVIFTTHSGTGISCAAHGSNLCVVQERAEDRKQAVVSALDPVKGRGAEIARFDLDPKEDVRFCEISLDGTKLAYSPSSAGPIHILSLRGLRPVLVPIRGLRISSDLSWAADGKGLYFGSSVKGRTVLLHIDMKGRTHVVWENQGGGWAYATPSSDGRHLAIAGETMNSNMWMMENF
jgi:Tol biopolymer transport system component